MDQKKYGLIKLSKPNKTLNTVKPSIFGSDSDSDEVNSEHKSITSSGVKRQTQIDISRALNVDPNVFEYDSIYDDMKSKKESVIANESQQKEKKPKYIKSLLKFSENRKKEQERRVERKIQKERENEGNMFADKEAFVTTAYKLKLEEIKVAEENDRREQAIDELLDVTKQKDLSGFYRNLLNNNISADSTNSKTELSDSPNEVTKTSSKQKPNRQIRRRRSSSEESSNSSVDEDNDNIQNKTNTTQKVDNKLESNKKVKHDSESNSNSDSNDSSVDSPKIKSHNNQEIVENRSHHSIDSSLEIDSPKDKINNEINNKTPKLDKRAILIKKFTKRTIGDVFEAAKQRYFERKDKYLIE